MEKKIMTRVNHGTADMKQTILNELNSGKTVDELREFVQRMKPFQLDLTDFNRRKRNNNSVPIELRCIARKAANDQCTRRRKDGQTCCGTHCKGVPHGYITTDSVKTYQKEVWTEDILGIIYYIDADNNVYKTEDILKNNVNPKIIAKWSKEDDMYTIHHL
jgi:hypothetical protein